MCICHVSRDFIFGCYVKRDNFSQMLRPLLTTLMFIQPHPVISDYKIFDTKCSSWMSEMNTYSYMIITESLMNLSACLTVFFRHKHLWVCLKHLTRFWNRCCLCTFSLLSICTGDSMSAPACLHKCVF